MPEGRFPIELRQVRGKAVPRPAGAGRLEVVDQDGDVERRVDTDQQVHMVGLAAKLDQLAAPRRKDFRKGGVEVRQQRRRQRFAAILGHKNNV